MAAVRAEEVLAAAAAREAEQQRGVAVHKDLELEFDLGNLLALDRNPPALRGAAERREALLRALARGNAQPAEPPARGAGRKRRFEPLLGDLAAERGRQLEMLRGMSSKKPALDITRTVNKQLREEDAEAAAKGRKRAQRGKRGRRQQQRPGRGGKKSSSGGKKSGGGKRQQQRPALGGGGRRRKA
ncbi:ribosome biogenesis regulatory protein homolog [Nothoprocta perdicaria]|uniref:ribosome biogenesis regulatory protein homolog n=1 Tax=Nothoprocta perdicaria TaxID=30464 RepID=UPI000E1B8A63|nr:ribosome biogenesis regulatory protein homolog [Nothoprocta perdicaria]